MRVVAWTLAVLALAGSESSEAAEIRRLETRKTALEMEKKMAEFTQQMRQLSGTSDAEVFKTIGGFADEGDRILDKARAAESDEEKILVLEEGLAKRTEWVKVLSDAKDAMEEAQQAEQDDEEIVIDDDVEGEHSEEDQQAESDAMVGDVAKLFQKAVRDGNVKVMLDFMNALSKTPGTLTKILNHRDSVGATALHWCAFYGTEAHIALAKVFVKVPGIDLRLEDNHNQSACITACMKGHHEMLDLFLNAAKGPKCDPMKTSAEGLHCAHYAARQDNVRLMQVIQPLLTPENVDVYANASLTATPLYFATENSSEDIIKILLEAGASSAEGKRLEDGTVQSCKEKAQLDLMKQIALVKMLGGKTSEARSEL
mmetsp:Transcript_5254/g.12500  ORF Transcript_5254/g.12500 Transcript_5254/m.12500 type:complete len:371 (+) Transcript_5254:32-1144(+)